MLLVHRPPTVPPIRYVFCMSFNTVLHFSFLPPPSSAYTADIPDFFEGLAYQRRGRRS